MYVTQVLHLFPQQSWSLSIGFGVPCRQASLGGARVSKRVGEGTSRLPRCLVLLKTPLQGPFPSGLGRPVTPALPVAALTFCLGKSKLQASLRRTRSGLLGKKPELNRAAH